MYNYHRAGNRLPTVRVGIIAPAICSLLGISPPVVRAGNAAPSRERISLVSGIKPPAVSVGNTAPETNSICLGNSPPAIVRAQ